MTEVIARVPPVWPGFGAEANDIALAFLIAAAIVGVATSLIRSRSRRRRP